MYKNIVYQKMVDNGINEVQAVVPYKKDTIKKYYHISIAIVSTNISELDKLENKIKSDTLHRMYHLNVRYHKLNSSIMKQGFEEYMFEYDDYIIFNFPKLPLKTKYCALNNPDVE